MLLTKHYHIMDSIQHLLFSTMFRDTRLEIFRVYGVVRCSVLTNLFNGCLLFHSVNET